jgi:hypothetical protein
MAVTLSRMDKVNKINAEIARLEVEMELEGGGGGIGKGHAKTGVRGHFRDGQYFSSSFGKMLWDYVAPVKKNPAGKGVAVMSAVIDIFKDRVLDPSLKELGILMGVSGKQAALGVVKDVGQGRLTDYVDVGGWLSENVPTQTWLIRVSAVSDPESASSTVRTAEFLIVLYVRENTVSYRVLRVIAGQKLHITKLPPLYAWTGEGKGHYFSVIGALGGWIRQLFYKEEKDLLALDGQA